VRKRAVRCVDFCAGSHRLPLRSIERIFTIYPFVKVLLPLGADTVEIRRCFGGGETCSKFRASGKSDVRPEGMRRCATFANRDNAIAYLRRCGLNPDAIAEFRSLLVEETDNVWRLNDHQVVEQIAVRLAQRALCVIPPTARPATALAPAAERTKHDVDIPSPQLSPTVIVLPKVRTPQPPQEPPEMNPLDEADHDAQAATLEAASRGGVPFCAVCEKAQRVGRAEFYDA
jgi:hypothetical protein